MSQDRLGHALVTTSTMKLVTSHTHTHTHTLTSYMLCHIPLELGEQVCSPGMLKAPILWNHL